MPHHQLGRSTIGTLQRSKRFKSTVQTNNFHYNYQFYQIPNSAHSIQFPTLSTLSLHTFLRLHTCSQTNFQMPQVDTNSPNLSPNSKSQPNGNHINGHNTPSNLPSPSEILKRLRSSGAVDRIRKAIDSRLNASESSRVDHVKELTNKFLNSSSANLNEPRMLFTAVQQQVLPSVQQLIAKEVSSLTEDGQANWFQDMFLNEFDKALIDDMKNATNESNENIDSGSANGNSAKDINIKADEEKGYEQQLMDRLNRNLFNDKKASTADKPKTNVLETQGNKIPKEKKIISASKPPKNKMDKKGRPTNLKQTDSGHSSRRSKESSPSHSKDNESPIEKERSPRTNLNIENVSKESPRSPRPTEKKINNTEGEKEPNANLVEEEKEVKEATESLIDKQSHSPKNHETTEKTSTPLHNNEEKSLKTDEIEELEKEIFGSTPTPPKKSQGATNDTENTIQSPKEQQKLDEAAADLTKKLDEVVLDSDNRDNDESSICKDKQILVTSPEKQKEDDSLAVNSSEVELEKEPSKSDETKDPTPEPDVVETPDTKTGETEAIVQKDMSSKEKTTEKESEKSTIEVRVEENDAIVEPVIEKEEEPEKIEANGKDIAVSDVEPVVSDAPKPKSDLAEDITNNATEVPSSNIEQMTQLSTSDKQSSEQLQHIENPVNVATSGEANEEPVQEPDHKVSEIDTEIKPSEKNEQMVNESKVNEIDTEIRSSEIKEQMINDNQSNEQTDMAVDEQELEKVSTACDDKLTEKPFENQDAEKSDLKSNILENSRSEIKDEKRKEKRRERSGKKKRKRSSEMPNTNNGNNVENRNGGEESEIQPRRKRKIRPSQRLRDGTEQADMSILAKIGSSRAEHANEDMAVKREEINSSPPKKLKKSHSQKHTSMENDEPSDEIRPRKRGRKPKRKRGRPSNAEIRARNNNNDEEVAPGTEVVSKTKKKSFKNRSKSASEAELCSEYRWRKRRCIPQDIELQRKIIPILEKLKEKDYAYPFTDPVDPSDEGCHDYYDEVKNPMDINTIILRLHSSTEIEGYYETVNDVLQDINQIWENCITFNSLHDPISKDASKCKVDLEVWLEEINISSGKGMRTKRRESFKLKESMKNEKKAKQEKAGASGSKRKQVEQHEEERKIDPNDGRLVGKSGAVYDQYNTTIKSWYFFTVDGYNQVTESYKLVWDCDRPTTEEARFGTGEVFPVYKIS